MPLALLAAALVMAAVIAVFTAVFKIKEQSETLAHISREVMERIQLVEERMEDNERAISDNFAVMRKEQRDDARLGREEQSRNIATLGDTQANRLKEIGDLQRESMESFSNRLSDTGRSNEERLEAMRSTVEAKLAELQKSNEEKLEKMRATVDEKLHSTLEQRLGEAFASVSERLEQVHQGLGEMKALSEGVGDLRKVLTNVKTRGTWGEVQLGMLLEQILTHDQYDLNVATRPGSNQRVEYAVKLPGGTQTTGPVMLPIDSKFPIEDYNRLITASQECDETKIAELRESIRRSVESEAKKISEKYIEPPYTTDFAILYLPIEGLYAEVLRIDGLSEKLASEYKIVPAGPTTITALLNSLQMGFRTLAIQKRSSEVWVILGKVKTEFDKFGDVLANTQRKIELVGKELEKAQVRNRAIKRELREVEKLPLNGDEFGAEDITDIDFIDGEDN